MKDTEGERTKMSLKRWEGVKDEPAQEETESV